MDQMPINMGPNFFFLKPKTKPNKCLVQTSDMEPIYVTIRKFELLLPIEKKHNYLLKINY